MNKKVRVMTEKEKNKGKKLSEIIFGDKYEPTDIENLSDEELRATRFVDGWTEEEVERIIKEWERRGLQLYKILYKLIFKSIRDSRSIIVDKQ